MNPVKKILGPSSAAYRRVQEDGKLGVCEFCDKKAIVTDELCSDCYKERDD